MRTLCWTICGLLLGVSLPAVAAEPAEIGEIEAEIEDRQAAIKKDFGSKLSKSERKDLQERLSKVREEVFREKGLDPKDYEKSSAKLDRREFKDMQAAKEKRAAELEAKKKAPAPEAPKKAEEVVVERNVPQRDLDTDMGMGGKEIEVPQDGAAAAQKPAP